MTQPLTIGPASEPAGDRSLLAIAASLKIYQTALSAPKVSDSAARTAANALLKAMRVANAMPSYAGYDALLTFFRENQNGVGSDRVALSGVSTLPSSDFTLVSTMFTTIRWLITRVGRRPDGRKCGDLIRSDRFSVWASLPTTLMKK